MIRLAALGSVFCFDNCRFFGIEDPDDPHLYHIVINTSVMNLEYASDVIAGAARALAEHRLEA